MGDAVTEGRVAWRDPAFDDSTWAQGKGELGYGDGDEATTVASGPDSTANDITTYFRTSFTVTDPAAFTGLEGMLVAVEVHQGSTSSSDVSFDLMLRGARLSSPDRARRR